MISSTNSVLISLGSIKEWDRQGCPNSRRLFLIAWGQEVLWSQHGWLWWGPSCRWPLSCRVSSHGFSSAKPFSSSYPFLSSSLTPGLLALHFQPYSLCLPSDKNRITNMFRYTQPRSQVLKRTPVPSLGAPSLHTPSLELGHRQEFGGTQHSVPWKAASPFSFLVCGEQEGGSALCVPECWLKFGTLSSSQVVCLLSSQKDAQIRDVSVGEAHAERANGRDGVPFLSNLWLPNDFISYNPKDLPSTVCQDTHLLFRVLLCLSWISLSASPSLIYTLWGGRDVQKPTRQPC